MKRHLVRLGLLVAALGGGASAGFGQAPTILHEPQVPGSTRSTLGVSPGAGAIPFVDSPGMGGDVLGARIGPSFPRVPTSITMPGGGFKTPIAPAAIAPPVRLPIDNPPVYGPLDLPTEAEDEGPRDGLTLDMAIERLVHANLGLRSRFQEIPLAQADLLTAGLRSNPVFYADSQLQPYGKYSRSKPGGPAQYDVNISHPLDLSHKRQARTLVAARAKGVVEAQYQDAVRIQIDNLYTAYVDVLAARETVRFARASVSGLTRVLQVTQELYKRSDTTRPDVNRVRILHAGASSGLNQTLEAERRSKQTLATLLSVPPEQAEGLALRATISDMGPDPPPAGELISAALASRPDLHAYRLGVSRAEADVHLARTYRFADAYLLYQPYTFQNNAPFGGKSSTSWALGLTLPLPIHNRNQGNVQRAQLNVSQTYVELSAIERRVAEEVIRAVREYTISKALLRRLEREVLPTARQMRDDAFTLYTTGEQDVLGFLEAQRSYNDVVRQYRDTLVRHRRSMLGLNTAVGQRIMP